MPELRLRGYGGGSAQRVEVSGGQGRRRHAQRGRNMAREREQVRSLRGGDPGTRHSCALSKASHGTLPQPGAAIRKPVILRERPALKWGEFTPHTH